VNSLASLVTVVVAGVVAMVGAGALIARRLNGHGGDCPIPEHVAMLAEHSKAIKVLEERLNRIEGMLTDIRDAVVGIDRKE